MQRARLVFPGAVYVWRRLSQLSSSISARLSERREAVAVGSDEMVDLDFIEAGLDGWAASSAPGNNSLHASAASRFTEEQQRLTDAKEIGSRVINRNGT